MSRNKSARVTSDAERGASKSRPNDDVLSVHAQYLEMYTRDVKHFLMLQNGTKVISSKYRGIAKEHDCTGPYRGESLGKFSELS